MRNGGDPVSLSNGVLNLTSWLGNVIMPTLAGLFAAAAVYQFSRNRHHHQFVYAALASLMCSGLLRAMESFANQSAWNNPDRYWISILTLVNWVGNVLLPLYGVLQVVLAVTHYAGLLERMTVGEPWVRNLVKTLISLSAIDVHSEGRPFTALAMVPPHLVEKWAREAFLTLPGIRVFLIDDLRNGGGENIPHGVNEVRMKQGRIVREGLHTTLSEMRLRTQCSSSRQRWMSLCGRPALFIGL
jgi:hypothetical protein